MHLYDVPEPIRSVLLNTAMPSIRVIAVISAYTRGVLSYQPDGTPVFAPGYPLNVWMDVTRLASAPVSISLQKPILPADGAAENTITASEVALQFINSDEFLAVTQQGAIFDPEKVEQTEIALLVELDEDPALRFPIYTGRVIGLPTEEFGLTTFTVRDSLWKVIRQPVLFEKFDPVQQSAVIAGVLTHGSYTVGNTPGDQVKFWDGIVTFAEEGQPLTSVTNSKPDDIEILKIIVNNKALPGKYTIEFEDATKFRVTYPDNEVLNGHIFGDYPQSANLLNQGTNNYTIEIPYTSWVVTGNPTGAKFEFYIAPVMSGNPVTMMMILLERGLKENWGDAPTFDATMPVDWQAFEAVQNYYAGWNVYVDATNLENKVWMKKRGGRPLSCLQLVQMIADHICCQVTVNNYGLISITSPGLYPESVWNLSDAGQQPAIIAHRVEAQTRFNFLKFNYGFNRTNNSFSTHILYDLRQAADDEKEEIVLNLPFYKQNLSLYEANHIAETYRDRLLKSFVRVELTVKPNWGLLMIPGDRFRLLTTTPPRLDMYVEVYAVDKNIGGECILRCVKVQAPKTDIGRFCETRFCEGHFC